MDALRQRELDDLDGGLLELRRRLAVTRILLRPHLARVPGAWLDDFRDLRLEKQRPSRAKRATKKPRGKTSTREVTHDTSTVPGAIRVVLAKHGREGLRLAELTKEVHAIRPETPEGAVGSSLHPMVTRGEIAREGYRKSYRYILTSTAKATEDTEVPV